MVIGQGKRIRTKDLDPTAWTQKFIKRVLLASEPVPDESVGIGSLVSRLQYSYDELLNHVTNRLNQLDYRRKQENSFLGRMSNKLFGGSLEEVSLDGMVICQLLLLCGLTPPEEIVLTAGYAINHNYARAMLDKARNDPDPDEYARIKDYDWRTA